MDALYKSAFTLLYLLREFSSVCWLNAECQLCDIMTCQVASLKRQLEFSQMQVSELQQASTNVRCCSERLAVDGNVQQRLSGQTSHVSLFTCSFICKDQLIRLASHVL